MSQTGKKIAVIICSVGRPDCLRQIVPALNNQTRPADRVLFVVTKPEDIGFDPAPLFGHGTRAETVIAAKGLPKQRNAGLDLVQHDCDYVVYYDDDFVPSRFALAGVERAFEAFPDVNGMTGHLIADGIHGTGISEDEAVRLVSAFDSRITDPAAAPLSVLRRGLTGLYGCNMAYRISAIRTNRFDERLPLYAWQEDIDFAARIAGSRIKTNAFSGVHRGAKSGRETAGRRLGYSQVANPWYLWRKGTMPARFAFKLAFRNTVANHVKAIWPEPWIDRRARAFGNWIAIFDILAGRSDPGRILDFP